MKHSMSGESDHAKLGELLQAICARPPHDHLPVPKFKDGDSRQIVLFPVGAKFMKVPDCTPDIINRLTTRSPASKTSSIVSKGPSLPGIERFAQMFL